MSHRSQFRLGKLTGANFRLRRRHRCRNYCGQAMVELLFIAITMLFTILGVLQLALALNAYSLVRYAAYNAARSGIVHGADLTNMKEAARISLLPIFPRHGRADHLRGYIDNYLAAKTTDDSGVFTYLGEPITEVKVLNKGSVPCGSVVTFDDPKSGNDALLTVQVVHHYELVIPLVNRIIFYVYEKLRGGNAIHKDTLDKLASVTDKMRRTGSYHDIEYRIPIVAHYTMRMQSDYVACPS